MCVLWSDMCLECVVILSRVWICMCFCGVWQPVWLISAFISVLSCLVRCVCVSDHFIHSLTAGASVCSLYLVVMALLCDSRRRGWPGPAAGMLFRVSCHRQAHRGVCHHLELELFCVCTAGEMRLFVNCDCSEHHTGWSVAAYIMVILVLVCVPVLQIHNCQETTRAA